MSDASFRYFDRRLSFRQRVWALLFIAVTFQLALIAGYFHYVLADTLNSQVSTRALIQAREIASDPQLINAVQWHDIRKVRQQIDRLQRISDAEFIVVGDSHGIRMAHPNPDKIGLQMQGGDNERALKFGMHYYSVRQGTLGLAIRGKSPIIAGNGQILGVVSVGYLIDTVDNWLTLHSTPFFFALLFIFVTSSLAAWLFSRHIKGQMYGMEPEEIALSLRMRNSVFEAIYEGVIAIDRQGCILSANQRGLSILGIAYPLEFLRGKKIERYVTPADFFIGQKMDGLQHNEERQHGEVTCNGETLTATRVKIWEDNHHLGWVVSFTPRNNVTMLTSQLTQIREQTDSLRVVSHEYANKLSTISGLIKIGAYDRALSVILEETETHQKLIDFISQTFKSKVVAGLLLGKYSRAKELDLQLSFDPCCQLSRTPYTLSEDELAAIIGNLLDNAFEATLGNPNSNKCISILLTDANDSELVVEVADNGTGLSEDIAESMFSRGVSSKNRPGHGIGLYLIHKLVSRAGGTILVDDAAPCGTIFSLFIPNKDFKNGSL